MVFKLAPPFNNGIRLTAKQHSFKGSRGIPVQRADFSRFRLWLQLRLPYWTSICWQVSGRGTERSSSGAGPGAAPIRGGKAEPGVGSGHHLRADPRGLPVLGDGTGRVQPKGGGLGEERAADGGAGAVGAGDGAREAGGAGRGVPFRPRLPVYGAGVQPALRRGQHPAIDGAGSRAPSVPWSAGTSCRRWRRRARTPSSPRDSPSEPPGHQQLGDVVMVIRAKLVPPVLVLDSDQQMVRRSKHRAQIPGGLRLRENPVPDLVTELVGRPADVLGMTGHRE